MSKQPGLTDKVKRCHLLDILQIVTVVSFLAALHTAISHQGEVPATLYVLWVVTTALVATVSLALSSNCEVAQAGRDRTVPG